MVPVHMTHPNENDSRSQAAVRADAVTLGHGHHVAVTAATFHLPAGRSTVVVGPNGSGKSTVLHAVAGLLTPWSGTLTVTSSGADIAYVPQHLHADERLPIAVRDVVTMGRYARRGALGRLRGDDRAAVSTAMERLDVTPFARRQLAELSGGERQRVLVAQALAQEAQLLLLDEPLTGLDLPSQERIQAVVDEERAAGRTVVASTHSLAEAAMADHVLLLAGRVVAEGPPHDVLTEENLLQAYGTLVVSLEGGAVLVDDTPHHHAN
jgi:manganese transport system ATP-binding protein